VTELVVDARILVYRVIVGISNTPELPALDARLSQASTLIAPSCEFLRSHRMLKSLARDGDLTPSEAMRLSMLVCESGVELRPLWPWDIPRISTLNCHPSDAWCIAVAESVGVTLVTRNALLESVGAVCPIEVY
jgi:predicted nucleic acid-binding protein